MNLRGGDNWQEMCATTPGHVQGRDFDGPTSCATWVSWLHSVFFFLFRFLFLFSRRLFDPISGRVGSMEYGWLRTQTAFSFPTLIILNLLNCIICSICGTFRHGNWSPRFFKLYGYCTYIHGFWCARKFESGCMLSARCFPPYSYFWLISQFLVTVIPSAQW